MINRGVKAVAQPSPARNPGGDCFACAMTAGLRALFPNTEIDFNKVWECWQVEQRQLDGSMKTFLSNTWSSARTALYNARHSLDLPIEIRADIVAKNFNDPERWPHSFYGAFPGYEWALRLEAWLSAGWLALAVVNYAGNPSRGEWKDGYRMSDDHFVLLDGVRSYWKGREGSASLAYEIHVVCSAAGGREYWITLDDLLQVHGAGAWWLFRREDEREYRE